MLHYDIWYVLLYKIISHDLYELGSLLCAFSDTFFENHKIMLVDGDDLIEQTFNIS
jgi:hypothetical protein